MGNGAGKWLLTKLMNLSVPNLPTVCDVLFVDWSIDTNVKKALLQYNPRLLCVAVNDGPVPTAKVRKRFQNTGRSAKMGKWSEKVPSGLKDTLINPLTRLSEKTECHIVLNHRLVKGEADYKIAELYRNWACSTSYLPNLNYVIESCDSDVILVALGFHESLSFFVEVREVEDKVVKRCYDLHRGRERICELMGGGDVRRRVDDFRALAVFAANDFHDGLKKEEIHKLIEAYKAVTQNEPHKGDFLVDGDQWNGDVLKALLATMAKRGLLADADAPPSTPAQCQDLFRYLVWGLQLYNGFCAGFDYVPEQSWPRLPDLVANFDLFDGEYQFADDDAVRMLPPTVLKQIQEVIPADAPDCVKACKKDLFGGMFANVNGEIVRRLTIAKAAELYEARLRNSLLAVEPKVEKECYALPWFFHNGRRQAIEIVKRNPDFDSLLRRVPQYGATVIYKGRAVGLFRDVLNGEKCLIQLYFLNLEKVADGQVTAIYVGPVVCELDDLEWARNVRRQEPDQANPGLPVYISCGCKNFGVVGLAMFGPDWCKLTVSSNQIPGGTPGPSSTRKLDLRNRDVRPFHQLPLEDMRRCVHK